MQESALQPPERQPLRDALAERITEAIVGGEFEPGQRLKDTELANALGASRTPVREALLGLVDRGYLISEPGRGFRVAAITESEASEIYELIRLLEVYALRNSAPCTSDQARELRQLAQQMAQDKGTPVERLTLDERWHETLLAGMPNSKLHQQLRELRHLATRYEAAYFASGTGVQDSLDEHEAITRAFESGQIDRAAEYLAAHWLRSQELTIQLLRKAAL